MDEAPFVERKFELGDEEIVARFFLPARAEGGEFQCRWTIAWPEGEEGHRAFGEDGIQALMLAMRVVHTKLTESEAYQAGRLTLWGQSDLDLPPGWGTGPLYSFKPARGSSR